MKCPICGFNNPEEATRCASCGRTINNKKNAKRIANTVSIISTFIVLGVFGTIFLFIFTTIRDDIKYYNDLADRAASEEPTVECKIKIPGDYSELGYVPVLLNVNHYIFPSDAYKSVNLEDKYNGYACSSYITNPITLYGAYAEVFKLEEEPLKGKIEQEYTVIKDNVMSDVSNKISEIIGSGEVYSFYYDIHEPAMGRSRVIYIYVPASITNKTYYKYKIEYLYEDNNMSTLIYDEYIHKVMDETVKIYKSKYGIDISDMVVK